MEQARRALHRAPPFAALSTEGLAQAASKGRWLEVPRRAEIPAKPEGLLVVGSGRVRALRRVPDREVTLGYYAAGEVACASCLIDGAADPAVLVAVDHVEAVRVPLPVVRGLLGREAGFGARLLEVALARKRALEDRIEAVLVRPVESRIAEFLLGAADRHGVPDPRGTLIGVKYTHQEIASYVGSTRETTTLVLGELKRAGLIETDHRRVIITDEAGLRARV